jgi:two-component system response regulator MprA
MQDKPDISGRFIDLVSAPPMSTILIVEDEAEIAGYLRRGLTFEGYTVEIASDGRQALDMAREQPPDLVVLDLMLPGIDGLEVARRLRAASDVPIIMLTARDAIPDRVAGLEAGADDYLIKPFAFEELLARIRVQLRRRQREDSATVLRYGPLTMDLAAHEVTIGDRRVDLTAKEYDLLELFMRHPQQVLTRDVIYDRVWGYNFGGESNIIEVYVRYLRQKLEAHGEPRLIHTVRGVGYILREE